MPMIADRVALARRGANDKVISRTLDCSTRCEWRSRG